MSGRGAYAGTARIQQQRAGDSDVAQVLALLVADETGAVTNAALRDRGVKAPAQAIYTLQLAGYHIDRTTCAGIERHLAACPRCAQSCVQLGKSASLCRKLPGDEVPRSVRTAVRQALLAALRAESSA